MRVLLVALSLVLALGALGCGDGGGGGPDCGGEEGSEVCEVFRLVNEERRAAGLEPYVWDRHLALSAQRHAEDMAENGYFSHTSQDDASPRGENIAQGYRTAADVMEGWMSSDGHRANILAGGSNEIGIGLRDFHWVQVFGTRAE
jgi:uncharacterized protein YkwD